jgi:hypothetical protein
MTALAAMSHAYPTQSRGIMLAAQSYVMDTRSGR